MKAERNEEIYLRIDSTVLLSLLSYCSHSAEHIDEVIRQLGSQIIEFTRKCSRLLLLQLKPPEMPESDGKYRLKTDDDRLAELKVLE